MCQSVRLRMYLLRWWPMKPLTPRMRTFFKIDPFDSNQRQRQIRQQRRRVRRLDEALADREFHDLETPAVRAIGVPAPGVRVQARRALRMARGQSVDAR